MKDKINMYTISVQYVYILIIHSQFLAKIMVDVLGASPTELEMTKTHPFVYLFCHSYVLCDDDTF